MRRQRGRHPCVADWAPHVGGDLTFCDEAQGRDKTETITKPTAVVRSKSADQDGEHHADIAMSDTGAAGRPPHFLIAPAFPAGDCLHSGQNPARWKKP